MSRKARGLFNFRSHSELPFGTVWWQSDLGRNKCPYPEVFATQHLLVFRLTSPCFTSGRAFFNQRTMFQHFRLGEMAMTNPLPPHLIQGGSGTMQPTTSQFSGQTTFVNNPPHIISSSSGPKAPYGSGDSDDGYTLVFPNLQAFTEWREKEEENNIVEFVKVCVRRRRARSATSSTLHRVILMAVKPFLLVSKSTPSSSVLGTLGVAERNM